jgi:formamidopyrimidine-DNA glycosylase
MPELAEVDTVCVDLHHAIGGKQLQTATIYRPSWIRAGDPRTTQGQTLQGVQRWGKRLWWQWEQHVWVGSLGMTGVLALETPQQRHPMLAIMMDEQPVTWYDTRHFGSLYVYDSAAEAHTAFDDKIGVDAAASLSTLELHARFRGTRAPIKAALLNQRWIAGIGNYLADEMLWAAQLHPGTLTTSLTDDDWERLNQARQHVIDVALQARGMTVRDYRDLDGNTGSMQTQLQAYGRAGQPCFRCGTPLVKGEYAGRGTTWCEHCQPASSTVPSTPTR